MADFKARFAEDGDSFDVGVQFDGPSFNANMGETQVIHIGDPPRYEGPYAITPKVSAQTMPTKGKIMTEDVAIKSIPYFDVSNNTGGSTVYIGNEVE